MKRCKNCREPFTPIRSTLEKYCQKDECIRIFVQEAKEKDWKKRKSKAKNDLLTIQDYIKLAQQVFNKYIRERDKDKPCISCGKAPGSKRDAGHFFNANNHWAVRFDENNVHSQCVECNQHKHGNLIEYGVKLEQLIGPDEFAILRDEAYKLRKYTKDELKGIIETYKRKIREL